MRQSPTNGLGTPDLGPFPLGGLLGRRGVVVDGGPSAPAHRRTRLSFRKTISARVGDRTDKTQGWV
jgi:hypothetical protein